MDQISAVKHRDPGVVRERRIYEVIIFPHTADAWIGIKAGDDRICETGSALAQRVLLCTQGRQHEENGETQSMSVQRLFFLLEERDLRGQYRSRIGGTGKPEKLSEGLFTRIFEFLIIGSLFVR